MPPRNRLAMIRQELQLKENQQSQWSCDKRDLSDCPQHETNEAVTHIRRAGKQLHKDVARQLASQAISCVDVVDLGFQLRIEFTNVTPEQHKMKQHIGVD